MGAGYVNEALDRGDLTIEALDDKVRRILRIVQRAGAFDNPDLAPEQGVDRTDHRQLIREAARETIVLLTNSEILPLDASELKTIAVIGELAHRPNIMGGGSSQVNSHPIVSPLEGIRRRAGEQIDVLYAPGCFIHKTYPVLNPTSLTTMAGDPGLNLQIFDNLDFSGEPAYTAIVEKSSFGWFDDSVPNVNQERFCVRLTGYFTAVDTGTHSFGLSGVGQSRLFIDGELVLDNWSTDPPPGQNTTDLHMASGQSHTFKLDFRWEGNPHWRSFHLGHLPPHAADLVEEAASLAKRADVVILLAGLTHEWESEGFDRVDMRLPGGQDELIEAVAAANPNTVVVLNAGSAVSMPWVNKVSAVVEQWYNGQECGNALADVLFGDSNPSGKLPTTFPKRLEDNPAYINYPGENGKVLYGEGLFVGYRYYDKKDIEPLFPFGHGLSYTNFRYENLQSSARQFNAKEGITVSFDLSNSGSRFGQEIVQLYAADLQATVVRPEKELKAFTKVSLSPRETQTVTFHLDQEAFWFYDPAQAGWKTEPGEFEILIGASSRDLRLRTIIILVE